MSRNSAISCWSPRNRWISLHIFCFTVWRSRISLVSTLHIADFCSHSTSTEQHGVCRAISYIIQTLSAEPAFGSRLNHPIGIQLPTKWGPVDTAAEFVIHVRRLSFDMSESS
jgi:hypothetical protein